jgi:RNA polymerase sigma factor for flagellar operon FliA
VEQAVTDLSHTDRLIVALHYHEHLPFVEIAAMLGVTKGRVSQLHKAAVERMRARVREPGGRIRV